MGLLIIVDGGDNKTRKFDTVSCCHCQAVIKLVISGITKAKETKYRCSRCGRPICKHCAEVLGGACSPIMAKVERALKTGEWKDDLAYEYKILPHR